MHSVRLLLFLLLLLFPSRRYCWCCCLEKHPLLDMFDEDESPYDDLPIMHDVVDVVSTAADHYDFVDFSATPPTTPTLSDADAELEQSLDSAITTITTILPLVSSTPEHLTVLRMTKTALTRIQEHCIEECLLVEEPPLTGSRLRCGIELEMEQLALVSMRWKGTADINVQDADNGTTATWKSNINNVHWSSTRSTSRLHSGNYQVVLELQQVEGTHVRVGFLLEFIAANGRKHVDWGHSGGVLGTSATSWGIDVLHQSTSVTLVLNLPRDEAGEAYFVTSDHGRTATIPLPRGAVVVLGLAWYPGTVP